MILYFVHGWGFDRHFWAPLAALLPEWKHVYSDQGYFAEPQPAMPDGPCLAVTHSFGTMRVLSAPPAGLRGIAAFNGFTRFCAADDAPGVAERVIDRMLRRFAADPAGVLASFRASVGCKESFGAIDKDALGTDLLRLRREASPLPEVPVVSIQGDDDPLLSPDMRAQAFAGCDVRRTSAPQGGHLLPHTAPELCADAVRTMLAQLTR